MQFNLVVKLTHVSVLLPLYARLRENNVYLSVKVTSWFCSDFNSSYVIVTILDCIGSI